MTDDKEREFWTLESEKVPFQKGWFFRDCGLEEFMKKLEADPRGGRVIGMRFDGEHNIEFYTALNKDQMLKIVRDNENENKKENENKND